MTENQKKKSINKFFTIVFFACLLPFIFFLVEYSFIRLAHHSYWFNYNSVQTTKYEYAIGENVWGLSDSAFFQRVSMEWLDILYCDLDQNGLFERYSEAITVSRVLEPRGYPDPDELKEWRYVGKLPDVQTRCYLENHISVKLRYGMTKTQIVTTDIFHIK